ncbi:MAG: hypothetical protein VB064_02355 [Oscillospiraceae bacterium]|nr:hypothetical protein [Oscillospiraceae bacterium]
MKWIVFLLAAAGIFILGTYKYPSVYAPAAAALRKRAPKKLSSVDVAIMAIAVRMIPLIDLDPIRHTSLSEELKSLGHSESPEMFNAMALSRGFLMAVLCLPLLAVSPVIGIVAMVIVFWGIYSSQEKKLKRELDKRKLMIERELPQFAGTIRQSLNSTHDVIAIFESYRKVCGTSLRNEMDRTLNDMKTGNPERAVKALESRVNSAALSQLTRGLIGVMRGDDQRVYFDMLTDEYRKAQDESVAKELITRPEKLLPNMALLFGCIFLMVAVGLGLYLKQQLGIYFS